MVVLALLVLMLCRVGVWEVDSQHEGQQQVRH